MMTMKKAKVQMKNNNLKMTNQRQEMLDVFTQENRYMSAKEMQGILEKTFPSISQDTVYRNLNLFSDLSILESTELNGERLFKFHCNAEGHHHHHFICNSCGETTALKECPMDFFQAQIPGYKIESHRFDIFGECETCFNEK